MGKKVIVIASAVTALLALSSLALLLITREEVQTYEVEVQAYHIWQHTFIECRPYDTLDLTASGRWRENYGPEGDTHRMAEHANWALLNAPTNALVGRIGAHKFLVGRCCHLKLLAGEKGELRLCANDVMPGGALENQFKTKSGSLQVVVRLSRPRRGLTSLLRLLEAIGGPENLY